METIEKLQLGVTLEDIKDCICSQKKLKIEDKDVMVSHKRSKVKVYVMPEDKKSKNKRTSAAARAKENYEEIDEESELFLRVQTLKRLLPEIIVKGYPEAQRAVINNDGKTGHNELLVEGYGLQACMNTLGVIGTQTKTNSVIETREVLGIEAARSTIIAEIKLVMENMDIDPRHLQLLADVMTYKGEILGITRFGLAKMRDSVLQLASFEKTPDHLFEAAWAMKRDYIEGVSECIIMGQGMKVGTGGFQVVRDLQLEYGQDEDMDVDEISNNSAVTGKWKGLDRIGEKPTLFEDLWKQVEKKRGTKSRRG
jgi:DNA-directed RNA polymerase III subunit RPC1